VLGGLVEIAAASEVGLRVEQAAIPVRPEVRAVCDHLGIDPYTSISEGTLLVTVRPGHADGLLAALAAEGIEAAVVGEVTPPEAGRVLLDAGVARALEHPGLDPFWPAFARWTAEAAAPA
jgi:hydrogenase expression/formation protein HypE